MDIESVIEGKWGHLPNFKKRRNREEWHCGCPTNCGGDPRTTDRFMITFYDNTGIISGQCRQCGHTEKIFPDGNSELSEVTSEQLAEMREAARIRQEEVLKDAQERLDYHREKLHSYHDTMTDEQRDKWHSHWISDRTIDTYTLGYTPSKAIGMDDATGQWIRREALVIPVWGHHWTVDNFQFRILNPPPKTSKYKNVSGVPVGLFYTQPDEPLDGTVYITEGVKKALCLNQIIMRATGELVKIIAVPSSAPHKDLILQFSNVTKAYLILDPDTRNIRKDGTTIQQKVVSDFVALNPGIDLRPINLPVKVDDYFYDYGFTYDDFEVYVNGARPVLLDSVKFTTLSELRRGE